MSLAERINRKEIEGLTDRQYVTDCDFVMHIHRPTAGLLNA